MSELNKSSAHRHAVVVAQASQVLFLSDRLARLGQEIDSIDSEDAEPTEVDEENPYCRHCGAGMNPDDTDCWSCGA